MMMYFPQFKVLNMAEDATHTMHNLYTLRGAEIRDGRLWSRYISEAIERYGDQTDVVIAQHHWPMWGNERVVDLPEEAARPLQVHPRPVACGCSITAYTPTEIAETEAAGEPRQRVVGARLLRHAEPQRQGGLPILSRLVRRQPGRSESAAAGRAGAANRSNTWAAPSGASNARARISARASIAGCASVMSQLVFADPANARRASSAPMRWNSSATRARPAPGATPICWARRNCATASPQLAGDQHAWPDLLRASPSTLLFDFLGVRLNGAEGRGQAHRDQLDLHRRQRELCDEPGELGADPPAGQAGGEADAGFTLTRAALDAITLKETHLSRRHQGGRHRASRAIARKLARAVRHARRVHGGFRDRRAAEGERGVGGRGAIVVIAEERKRRTNPFIPVFPGLLRGVSHRSRLRATLPQ